MILSKIEDDLGVVSWMGIGNENDQVS